MSTSRIYCGVLCYTDSGEELSVTRLIVRQDAIAFDLVTDWIRAHAWNFSGVAKLLPSNVFLSEPIVGKEIIGNSVGSDSAPIRFSFGIEKQSEQHIWIRGALIF